MKIGFVVGTVGDYHQAASTVAAQLACDANDVLPLVWRQADILEGDSGGACLLALHPSDEFDAIAIHRSTPLWRELWARALLAHLSRHLVKGGSLLVDERPPAGRLGRLKAQLRRAVDGRPGERWLSVADLETILGAPVARGAYVRWVPGRISAPASIVTWYTSCWQEALLEEVWAHTLTDDALRGRFERLPADVVTASEQHLSTQPSDHNCSFTEQPDAFCRAVFAFHSYQVMGAAYKAPAVAHILRQIGICDARVADVGGGFGAMATDLLLLPGSPVREAVVVDVSRVSGFLAASVVASFPEALRGRLRFCLDSHIDWSPPTPIDAVVYMGSLLTAPRERLERVVELGWRGLRDGGVMVVLENTLVESPAGTQQFTEDELHRYLEPLGRLRFFNWYEMREVAARRWGARGDIVRFVVKGSR